MKIEPSSSSRGILYVMTSAVDGLIKIGKTDISQFKTRMNDLERNGYANVTGFKRKFAIVVDDYDDKERLLHKIFNKSRVAEKELFALDVDLVIALLSSFEGEQIYPRNESKIEIFEEATEATKCKEFLNLPEREYHLERYVKLFGREVSGNARVENGQFVVLKGSICAPLAPNYESGAPAIVKDVREDGRIEDNVLMADVPCSSPSIAAELVIGNSANGWTAWKGANDKPIDYYRDK